MSTNVQQTLSDVFGFKSFRPGQEQVIQSLLAGRSAAAIFPTGSGKSLCYQLPALLLPGLTLVVSPLIALMKDQIDALQARGIRAERLDSSLEEEDYRRVTQDIRAGSLRMLFVAPERLGNERFLSLIQGQKISLLAVDEAHCISSWGHNFRPEYLKLAQAAKDLGVERVLALTATATPQVILDMAESFAIAEADVVNTGFHRENLELRVSPVSDEDRHSLVLKRLQERPPGPAIIYVSLQHQAEDLAAYLSRNGIQAAPYHAGLAAELRSDTQDAFMGGRIPVICATIAFGMGVDKSDIRYIYHAYMAKGFESYLQEIGRAGRDGGPAICELFACPDDITTLENFVYGDTPELQQIRALLDDLFADDEAYLDTATQESSRAHDLRPLVVNTLMTNLELEGLLRSEGHYYSAIRLAYVRAPSDILASYPHKQANFLNALFASAQLKKKWASLDMDAACQATGHGRAVILRALNDLQERGHVELQMAGYRQRFRRLRPPGDLDALAQSLYERFQEFERREIARIHAMLDYAAEQQCLTGHLLRYFGEEISACGHCGPCLGEAAAQPPPRHSPAVPQGLGEQLAPLISTYPQALGRPRQQTRFLCGLTSPATSAARGLRSNPLFGRCREVPFADVLNLCRGN